MQKSAPSFIIYSMCNRGIKISLSRHCARASSVASTLGARGGGEPRSATAHGHMAMPQTAVMMTKGLASRVMARSRVRLLTFDQCVHRMMTQLLDPFSSTCIRWYASAEFLINSWSLLTPHTSCSIARQLDR